LATRESKSNNNINITVPAGNTVYTIPKINPLTHPPTPLYPQHLTIQSISSKPPLSYSNLKPSQRRTSKKTTNPYVFDNEEAIKDDKEVSEQGFPSPKNDATEHEDTCPVDEEIEKAEENVGTPIRQAQGIAFSTPTSHLDCDPLPGTDHLLSLDPLHSPESSEMASKRKAGDMDVDGDGDSKSLRASITDKYHERVDATQAKLGKEAKPRDKPEDVEEEELLDVTFKAPKDPVPCQPISKAEAPLLSLRELMPEGVQNTDMEDRTLDAKFRADKVEFLLMARAATDEEKTAGIVLHDAGEKEWEIPEPSEYFEVMGKATSRYTDKDRSFIHGLSWSSVGTQTGTGVFTIKTGRMDHITGFRGLLRDIINNGRCYESIPKQAIMNKYSLTLFISPSVAHVETRKVLEWLLDLNRGLKGEIKPATVKKFKASHPIPKRRGARIVSFTGDQLFLDSLHKFPRDYPFDVKVGNIYIRGGDRTEVAYPKARKIKRPMMTQAALQTLLASNSGDIVEAAMEAEDRLAGMNINK
jgi:hypothetical protein